MNTNIKKSGALFVALIVIILIIVGVTRDSGEAGKVKVGVILPLSGQYAALGDASRNAILLSQKDAGNDSVEFIFEDDKFETKTGLSAFQKLRDFDKVQSIIAISAPTIAAITPLITEQNVPTFQLGTELSHTKDPIFQLMPAGETVYLRLGEEAAKRYKNIAVVYENSQLFSLNAQFFNAGIPATSKATDFMTAPGADYRTEIQKILLSKPDTLAIFLPVENGIKFLKEFKNQTGNKKIPLVCDANTEIMLTQLTAAVGTEVFEGCISTAFPQTMTAEFIEEYKEAYKSDPQFASDYAYDAAQILFGLAKDHPVEDWVSVLEDDFKYKGMSGEIEFDEVGTRLGQVEVHIFKDGAFVPLVQ